MDLMLQVNSNARTKHFQSVDLALRGQHRRKLVWSFSHLRRVQWNSGLELHSASAMGVYYASIAAKCIGCHVRESAFDSFVDSTTELPCLR